MTTPLRFTRTARLIAVIALSLGAAVFSATAHAQTLPEIKKLVSQGQVKEALNQSTAYIAKYPKDPQGRFTHGLILADLGRIPEAIEVFSKITTDFPELPEPYNNLAVLYAQQKQYDKARSALEMAIRTHPSYATAHENLGDIYAKLASQAYGKALQLDSSNTATQTKLAMITELMGTGAKPKTSPPPAKLAEAKPQPETANSAAKPTTAQPPAPMVEAKSAPKSEPLAEPKEPKRTDPSITKANEATKGVKDAINGWANAWSDQNTKSYLGHYASNFILPAGTNRKEWEAERKKRIEAPKSISVSAQILDIKVENDSATVVIRQNYKSSSLQSSTKKTLRLTRTPANKWLITEERIK